MIVYYCMTLGATELILLFGAALLLFGPNKIPELARQLGQATTQYKKGLRDVKGSLMAEAEGVTSPLSDEDKLINTAKELGIVTEGKSMSEIAQEILNVQESEPEE